MERADKKSRLREWKNHQREAAEARLPLDEFPMQGMFDMLDAQLSVAGCNHTLRLTTSWLVAHGCDAERASRGLDDNGGFCDCEVLAKCEQVCREATGKA